MKRLSNEAVFLFENGEDDDLKGEESAQKKVWSEPKSKKSAH